MRYSWWYSCTQDAHRAGEEAKKDLEAKEKERREAEECARTFALEQIKLRCVCACPCFEVRVCLPLL